jgi:hypothetical protein
LVLGEPVVGEVGDEIGDGDGAFGWRLRLKNMGVCIWLLIELDKSKVEFKAIGENGLNFDLVGPEDIQMGHEILEVVIVQLIGVIEGKLTVK